MVFGQTDRGSEYRKQQMRDQGPFGKSVTVRSAVGGVDTNTITFSKLFTQGKANPAAVNRRNVQALFRKINRSMASPRCYI